MTIKRIIRPDRLRQVPRAFNWIDHRLVQDRHIQQCEHTDWALYLFLVTVGDYQGLSYYSDRSIQKLLSMDQGTLERARQSLIQADMIAFEHPLYQVLSLGTQRAIVPQQPRPRTKKDAAQSHVGPEAIGLILQRLREGS